MMPRRIARFIQVSAFVLLGSVLSAAEAQPIGSSGSVLPGPTGPTQPTPPSFPPPSLVIPQGPPNVVVVSCKPVESKSTATIVAVKCDPAIDKRFPFFAVLATADPRFAARSLSVMEAAQLGDKYLNIEFDSNDISGADWGCFFGCRPMRSVTMVESPIPVNRCIFDTNRVGCPGYCSTHDDISCKGFCDRQPNGTGCPTDCNRNAEQPGCHGFCNQHPEHEGCQDGINDPCIRHPHIPACRN
jgi:hypothetical protein